MAAITPAYIDEEINKYTLLLCDLRAQKNSFLPVSRLPTETLANVFILAARDYLYHESNADPPTLRVPNWVNVSYVCRHWRDVALNWPTLWTYHFTVSPRWTEELLARSKQAPLKISIRTHHMETDYWWTCLLEKALSHAERIEELRLDVSAKHISILSLCAPGLRVLDISSDSSWGVVIKDGSALPLRTLKLSGCRLPWHSLNLNGITTLFLERIPPSSQQDLGEFLGTLSRMQALRVLHLDHSLRDILTSGASDVSPKVDLPFLVRFFIAAPLSTALAFLSHTIIPLKTRVWLETTSESNSDEDYARIPPVVSQRFRQCEWLSPPPTIRSMVIRFPHMTEPLTICASEHDGYDPRLSMAYPPQDCDVSLMIRIRMEPSLETSDRDNIISNICWSIPSAHIQTLHAVNPTFSSDFWEDILEHLEGLRRMKLSDGLMPNLISLLYLTDELAEASNDYDLIPDYIFVPDLEELALYSLAFASGSEFHEDAISEEELRDAVSTREALRLTMTACFIQYEEEEEEEEEEEYDDDDRFYMRRCQCDECTGYSLFS